MYLPILFDAHHNVCPLYHVLNIVQVVFVDYGNEEIVRQDELCEMPQEYYQYSMQVQLDLHVAGLSTMHAVPAS